MCQLFESHEYIFASRVSASPFLYIFDEFGSNPASPVFLRGSSSMGRAQSRLNYQSVKLKQFAKNHESLMLND